MVYANYFSVEGVKLCVMPFWFEKSSIKLQYEQYDN